MILLLKVKRVFEIGCSNDNIATERKVSLPFLGDKMPISDSEFQAAYEKIARSSIMLGGYLEQIFDAIQTRTEQGKPIDYLLVRGFEYTAKLKDIHTQVPERLVTGEIRMASDVTLDDVSSEPKPEQPELKSDELPGLKPPPTS